MIWQSSPPVPLVERQPREQITPTDAPSLSRLKSALDAIPNSGANELDYTNWFRIVCAVHHATDGSAAGLSLVHEFSARAAKHNGEFLSERCWPYVRSERSGDIVTERTLFAAAAEHGWVDQLIADDFEVIEVDKTVSRETLPDEHERFYVWPEDELLARPRPGWIIKDVLPNAGLAVVYGASGSGKSFLMLDMMAAVARGEAWRGFKTKQMPVVYVAAEGQGGFGNRIAAYRQERGASGVRTIIDVPDLLKNDVPLLAKKINDSGGAGVIVIDTLAQAAAGGDENSSADMGSVIKACRKLRERTSSMIVLVHHSGKDAAKGARGHSSLKAAVDAEIEVVRLDRIERAFIVGKLKDGEDGKEYGFTLSRIMLGVDADGNEMSSCVVEHHDHQVVHHEEASGKNQKILLQVITHAIELSDDLTVDEAVNLGAAQKAKPAGRDTRRQVMLSAFDDLSAKGIIEVVGMHVKLKRISYGD